MITKPCSASLRSVMIGKIGMLFFYGTTTTMGPAFLHVLPKLHPVVGIVAP